MIPSLVITSWSDEGGNIYGNRFATGFAKHWRVPHGVRLAIRTDRFILQDPEVVAFREREADAETLSGCMKRGALKWSWKVFALTMEPMPREGWMIWIDGDVEFTKTPDQAFFDAVCPKGKGHSYLGRPWAYASETGFVAYNMSDPGTRLLLRTMRKTYLSGDFRQLDNWGDAAVFDHCRRMLPLLENNLSSHLTQATAQQDGLHVWPDTVLGEFMSHRKGPKRKKAAYGGVV